MKKAIVLLALILTGCGGGSGGGNQASGCGSKNLLSTWTRNSGTITFNLQGLVLYYPETNYIVSLGSQSCRMTVELRGNQCLGDYEITNSTWQGDGGSDPGCASFNETGTYTKSANGLRTCSTTYSTCHDYQ